MVKCFKYNPITKLTERAVSFVSENSIKRVSLNLIETNNGNFYTFFRKLKSI